IPWDRSRARRADVSYWFSRQPRVQKETRGALEDPSGDVATACLISPLELSRHVARLLGFRRDGFLCRGLARGFRRRSRLEPCLEFRLCRLRLIGQPGTNAQDDAMGLRVDAGDLEVELVSHLEAVRGLRSEEHTSELQSRGHLVCRLLLEKKKK